MKYMSDCDITLEKYVPSIVLIAHTEIPCSINNNLLGIAAIAINIIVVISWLPLLILQHFHPSRLERFQCNSEYSTNINPREW